MQQRPFRPRSCRRPRTTVTRPNMRAGTALGGAQIRRACNATHRRRSGVTTTHIGVARLTLSNLLRWLSVEPDRQATHHAELVRLNFDCAQSGLNGLAVKLRPHALNAQLKPLSERNCHTGTNVDAVEAAGKASKVAWTRAGRSPTQVGMAPANEAVRFGLTKVIAEPTANSIGAIKVNFAAEDAVDAQTRSSGLPVVESIDSEEHPGWQSVVEAGMYTADYTMRTNAIYGPTTRDANFGVCDGTADMTADVG